MRRYILDLEAMHWSEGAASKYAQLALFVESYPDDPAAPSTVGETVLPIN